MIPRGNIAQKLTMILEILFKHLNKKASTVKKTCSKFYVKYRATIKYHVQPPEQPTTLNSISSLTFTVDQIYAYYVITRKYNT